MAQVKKKAKILKRRDQEHLQLIISELTFCLFMFLFYLRHDEKNKNQANLRATLAIWARLSSVNNKADAAALRWTRARTCVPRFLRRAPVEREQNPSNRHPFIQFLPDVELFRAPTMVGLMNFTQRFYLIIPLLLLYLRRLDV